MPRHVAFGVPASAVRLDSIWVVWIAAVVLVPWRWDAWRRRRRGRSATVLLAVAAVVLERAGTRNSGDLFTAMPTSPAPQPARRACVSHTRPISSGRATLLINWCVRSGVHLTARKIDT
jgi:hypothetical protein